MYVRSSEWCCASLVRTTTSAHMPVRTECDEPPRCVNRMFHTKPQETIMKQGEYLECYPSPVVSSTLNSGVTWWRLALSRKSRRVAPNNNSNSRCAFHLFTLSNCD